MSIELDEESIASAGSSSRHSKRNVTTYASPNVRKGKWTTEEENYTQKIIALFNQGKLSIPAGTTLRSYLSEKLNCDPMRITKKFAGATSIGKVVYQPADSLIENSSRYEDPEDMEELRRLELLFLDKLNGRDYETQRTHSFQDSGRDATSPATAKITEVVERIRAHDRTLRSSEKHDRNLNNSPGRQKSGSMKRIVSAPNFSQLSSLHTPWRYNTRHHNDGYLEREDSDSAWQSNEPKIIYKTTDEIDIRSTALIDSYDDSLITSTSPSFKSKKRSISAMDLQEYELLTSAMSNDQEAGNLLLQFSENLKKSIPTSVKVESDPSDLVPVQFKVSFDSLPPSVLAPSPTQRNQISPEVVADVGLCLEEDQPQGAKTAEGPCNYLSSPLVNEIALINSTYNLRISDSKESAFTSEEGHHMKRSRSNELINPDVC